MGLGKREDLTLDRVRQALGTVAKQVRLTEVQSFTTLIFGIDRSGLWPDDLAQAMAEGAVLGDYRFLNYRTDSYWKTKTAEWYDAVGR